MPELPHPRVAIIGSGPAGLGAAYHLVRNGVPPVVFEAAPHIGGLARSFDLWGRRLDLGAHILRLRHPEVIELWEELLRGEYVETPRRTRVVLDRARVSYPYRPFAVVRALGAIETARCAGSYARCRFETSRSGDDLESWVVRRFGQRAFDLLLADFVTKLFGLSGAEIESSFARDLLGFQESPSLTAVLRAGIHPSSEEDLIARPLRGVGALIDRMAEVVVARGGEVRCNAAVEELQTDHRRVIGVRLAGVEPESFDATLVTVPLPIAASLVSAPEDIVDAAAAVRMRSLALVYLRIGRERLLSEQWLYFPSRSYALSRVTCFDAWPGPSRPDSVLSAEYWCGTEDALWAAPDDALATLAERELRTAGVLEQAPVLDMQVIRVRHAAPVLRHGTSRALARISTFLNGFEGLVATGSLGAIAGGGFHGGLLAGMAAAERTLGLLSIGENVRRSA